MRRRNQVNVKKIVAGRVGAALVGYIVGVLTAPKSGKETRHDIKRAAEHNRMKAEKDLKKLHTELDEAIKTAKKKSESLGSKAKDEFKEQLAKAQETKEKVREVISAIHEGDADDADLKRAVKNASSALEHLKDFLKK